MLHRKELEGYSFLSFSINTYEMSLSADKRTQKTAVSTGIETVGDNEDGEEDSDEDPGKDTVEAVHPSQRGRPENIRSSYAARHP